MTNALTVTTSRANEIYSKIDNPLAAITELGKLFHQSQIMGISTAGDGAVLALTCMCEGITPLEFAKTYHIIKGKPSMRADAMAAKFQAAGGKIKWINIGDDGKEAKALFEFDGQSIEMVYTIEDAKKAKGKNSQGKEMVDIPDGNWMKDRGSMLRARLITKSVRILAPGIIAGVYIADELEDFADSNSESAKADTKENRKKRIRELDEATTVTVSPETTPVVESAKTEETIIDAAVESPPFGTEDSVVNPDQLRLLAGAGVAAGFSIIEINQAAIALFGAANVKTITSIQAAELTTKFKFLAEAITLGTKYPSKKDGSKNMDREETLALLCTAVGVDQAWKAPDQRITNLINAIRKTLGVS